MRPKDLSGLLLQAVQVAVPADGHQPFPGQHGGGLGADAVLAVGVVLLRRDGGRIAVLPERAAGRRLQSGRHFVLSLPVKGIEALSVGQDSGIAVSQLAAPELRRPLGRPGGRKSGRRDLEVAAGSAPAWPSPGGMDAAAGGPEENGGRGPQQQAGWPTTACTGFVCLFGFHLNLYGHKRHKNTKKSSDRPDSKPKTRFVTFVLFVVSIASCAFCCECRGLQHIIFASSLPPQCHSRLRMLQKAPLLIGFFVSHSRSRFPSRISVFVQCLSVRGVSYRRV